MCNCRLRGRPRLCAEHIHKLRIGRCGTRRGTACHSSLALYARHAHAYLSQELWRACRCRRLRYRDVASRHARAGSGEPCCSGVLCRRTHMRHRDCARVRRARGARRDGSRGNCLSSRILPRHTGHPHGRGAYARNRRHPRLGALEEKQRALPGAQHDSGPCHRCGDRRAQSGERGRHRRCDEHVGRHLSDGMAACDAHRSERVRGCAFLSSVPGALGCGSWNLHRLRRSLLSADEQCSSAKACYHLFPR